MANLDIQRKNYENHLNMLELKIREAEKERDLAIAKQSSQKAGTDKNSPKDAVFIGGAKLLYKIWPPK